MPERSLDAVIIGAGQAGLATSYHLHAAGVQHLVLEAGRIGETWRSQRWDSFRLNTPSWMNRLPGEPEPTAPDAFASQAVFVAQLEAYARRFELPIRTSAAVRDVSSKPGGGRYRIELEEGEHLAPRAIVVAAGTQRVPRMPALATALPRRIASLPSAVYRNPRALPEGAVLVVGSGQSGAQIAEDLLEAGRAVYLCTSRVGRAPRRYRGRDMLTWLADVGFWDQRPEDLPDPALTRASQPLISGVGPLGHTVSLQDLAARGVTLLGRPTAISGAHLTLDESVATNIAFGDERSAAFRVLVDEWLQRQGRPLPALEPDPADAPHPDPTSFASPATLDLDRAGIRTVIWATGVQGDLSWLRVPGALDRDGSPVHRDGVGEVPGLYFMGMPWLSRRKSGIIFGVAHDAEVVAHHLTAYLGAHRSRR